MDLTAFLKQNVKKPKTQKYVASERIVGSDGKPVEWEIEAINTQREDILRNQAMSPNGDDLNLNKYIGLLAAACTKYPDLGNVELQNSYGVMGADNLLKAMLLPGEYLRYANKVKDVCGFNSDFNELVKDAKN